MAAGKLNLTIEKGATFTRVLTWSTRDETTGITTPVDLTGYTARSQFREEIDSSTAFISLTSTSGIALGGATGTITLTISAATTAALIPESGVWDLELVSGDIVTRLVEGKVRLIPEVTR